jgi:hypothetical protein
LSEEQLKRSSYPEAVSSPLKSHQKTLFQCS